MGGMIDLGLSNSADVPVPDTGRAYFFFDLDGNPMLRTADGALKPVAGVPGIAGPKGEIGLKGDSAKESVTSGLSGAGVPTVPGLLLHAYDTAAPLVGRLVRVELLAQVVSAVAVTVTPHIVVGGLTVPLVGYSNNGTCIYRLEAQLNIASDALAQGLSNSGNAAAGAAITLTTSQRGALAGAVGSGSVVALHLSCAATVNITVLQSVVRVS